MKISFKVAKTYALLPAVFIITSMMLGSQLTLNQALSQGQANNTSGINSNTTTTTPSNPSSSSISIHSSKGYVNGKIAYFIATDASDSQIAASITNSTGFKVNFAPNLALAPESARQQGYVFVNGIKTSGSPVGSQCVLPVHCLERKDTLH